jgi:hypothetical protein
MYVRFMTAPGYAFVAVTTATDDGVATPSIGAGAGGVTGGGVSPEGGGVDAVLPPPQPESANRKMQEVVTNNERISKTLQDRCAEGSRQADANPASWRIGARMLALTGEVRGRSQIERDAARL